MAEEHVRGRMLLEENPGNRNPALPPQFDTTGKGDYRKVTPENPLPTANYVMSESGLWIPEPEVRNTQLSGSKVEDGIPVVINKNIEVVRVFMGINIPSNMTIRLSPHIDVSKYSHILIQFRPGGQVNDFSAYTVRSLWHQGSSETPAFISDILNEDDSPSNTTSDWYEVRGVKSTISVRNKMDIDKTFGDLTVFGRRI